MLSLLTKFVVHLTTFWFVAGSMHGDAFIFASLLGFSVSLNGGVKAAFRQRHQNPQNCVAHAAAPGRIEVEAGLGNVASQHLI